MSSPHPPPPKMAYSPVSSPRTPRQSDISLTSVHTLHSERKYSGNTPPSTTIPAHPSTSTISRDSQASADDRPLTKISSLGTPLLDSSTTRIPKARVFLHRDQRPDRPKPNHSTSQSGVRPKRTLTPTGLSFRGDTPTPRAAREKRCVSDLHDAFQAHQLRVERTVTPAPGVWALRRGITDFGDSLGHDEVVPKWIPSDEVGNWKTTPDYDPCVVENEPSSKWTTSLRHLSNLYKKERNPPCIRGSILEVQPPSLTERLRLGVLNSDRRHGYRDMRERNSGRVRMSKRGKSKHGELTRRDSPTDVTCLPDADKFETGRDDYVGFLIQTQEERLPRPRRSWLRFLRRSRA